MLPVNRHHQWACPLLVRTRLLVSEGCCLGWGDGTFILYREDQRVAGSWISHALINLGQACFYLGVKLQRYVIFLWLLRWIDREKDARAHSAEGALRNDVFAQNGLLFVWP